MASGVFDFATGLALGFASRMGLPMAVPTLTTARFVMRPLQRSDAAALFPTLSDEQQCLYLSRERFASEDELWGWLAEPDWPGLTWIAVDADGNTVARLVAVPRLPEDPAGPVFEIGYITVMDRQGEGIAKECSAALIHHLFSRPVEQGGARKLTAEVDVRNTPSVRLLEALGFTREAHFREQDSTHMGLCDVYWYGLLRREWSPG
ncbi:MAG: GNAT family protein [Pseudomonadota bacterium]